MAKQPRMTAADADRALGRAGFALLRVKGSHHVYGKGPERVIVPVHAGRTLHPKVVRQVLDATGG